MTVPNFTKAAPIDTIRRLAVERLCSLAPFFAVLRWALACSLPGVSDARFATRAILPCLPLAVLILSVLSLVFTPINNTLVRTQEYEADIFGLNTSRHPDGFAEAAHLLGEYRKLDPSPLEEFLLFDHPSGRTRIYSPMRWKVVAALCARENTLHRRAEVLPI